ncbi:MAG: hypothetical protein JSS38_01560 [Nitrospira sp.]|nr:hypothetical protein [Nitrospira sp.]
MPRKRKPKQQTPREPQKTQSEQDDALAEMALLYLRHLLDLQREPYSVMLDETIAARKPSTTQDPLLKLHNLHQRALRFPEDVLPLDAHTARALAEEVGIVPPRWALDILKEGEAALVRDRRMDRNQWLGFKATGRGKTSEAERRVRANVLDQSMLRIWGLSLLDVSIKAACEMEAGRMQRLAGWNSTDYDVEPDLQTRIKDPARRECILYDKRLKFAELLRQHYFRWRTDIEKDPNSELSQYFREHLLANREGFLAQFPTSNT